MKLSRLEMLIVVLCCLVLFGTYVVSRTLAEQGGGSPDSGEDSIIKQTYERFELLNYGSEEAFYIGENLTNWGPYWNRIWNAGEWVPETGLSESDVRLGTEFYEGSRSLKTGTLELIDYEKQSLLQRDDTDIGEFPNWIDYGETGSWTQTNTSPEVWYDEITGLYWSNILGANSNIFDRTNCDFFITIPRGDYNGGDADCGNAINICAVLSLDANNDGVDNTNWYLPSQKEMMQAYIHGINKKTNTAWVGTWWHWSSTEARGNSANAYIMILSRGDSGNYSKTLTNYNVRCVLRNL